MLRYAAKRIPVCFQQISRPLSFHATKITNSLSSGNPDTLPIIEDFSRRHIGPNEKELREMLDVLGLDVSLLKMLQEHSAILSFIQQFINGIHFVNNYLISEFERVDHENCPRKHSR